MSEAWLVLRREPRVALVRGTTNLFSQHRNLLALIIYNSLSIIGASAETRRGGRHADRRAEDRLAFKDLDPVYFGTYTDFMSGEQWAILGVNGGVTSLLVVAGMAKVVSPGQLARAIGEIFGHFSSAGTYTWLRGVAAIEVVAGLLLVVPSARPAASGVAGVLGLCFVIIGALGWRRGSATACGCFGARSDHPLGPLNVLLGTFLMSAPVVNWMMRAPENHARDFRMHALGASLGLLIFCLWINRALIRELTRSNDATREEYS